MTIDSRHFEIEQDADHREPTDVADDQIAVVFDNMIYGYFRDPQQTDAMLRRNGLTKAADRLVELFGPEWWTKI
jgi:hypothetical protein